MLTRGSERLSPKICAIGPCAHETTAGTSSATVIDASLPRDANAARSVKPMPSPPISICGCGRDRIFPQDSVASASSEPLRRLFINRSEEHTSELQSLMRTSYAVFCLKKKNTHTNTHNR